MKKCIRPYLEDHKFLYSKTLLKLSLKIAKDVSFSRSEAQPTKFSKVPSPTFLVETLESGPYLRAG